MQAASHTSYRTSYVLKDKNVHNILIIVQETISTLHFAENLHDVKLGNTEKVDTSS